MYTTSKTIVTPVENQAKNLFEKCAKFNGFLQYRAIGIYKNIGLIKHYLVNYSKLSEEDGASLLGLLSNTELEIKLLQNAIMNMRREYFTLVENAKKTNANVLAMKYIKPRISLLEKEIGKARDIFNEAGRKHIKLCADSEKVLIQTMVYFTDLQKQGVLLADLKDNPAKRREINARVRQLYDYGSYIQNIVLKYKPVSEKTVYQTYKRILDSLSALNKKLLLLNTSNYALRKRNNPIFVANEQKPEADTVKKITDSRHIYNQWHYNFNKLHNDLTKNVNSWWFKREKEKYYATAQAKWFIRFCKN